MTARPAAGAADLGTGAAYERIPTGPDSYGEPVCAGFEHVFHGALIHRERSPFQNVEVYDNPHFGRMLVLDGLIQTTERDEFCYHEMLVHPVLSSLDAVDRVLVIGGGDGGALRHVLQHGAGRVVMCEIDEAVTRLSRQHLPSVSASAFDDPRATVVFDDGAAYVREQRSLDAIIVDSTDPIGPAVVLFSPEFYADCANALRSGGALVTQSGSPVYQLPELQQAITNMRTAFQTVEVYLGFVPTYPGVLWSFIVGTNGPAMSAATTDAIATRLLARSISPRYYTPEVHLGAFALPAFVAAAATQAGARAQP